MNFVKLIILLLTLSTSMLAKESNFSTDEPRFYLAIQDIPHLAKPIRFYESPKNNAKPVETLDIFEKNSWDPMTAFNDKKEPFSFRAIPSTKKVNDFYKVYYKKKYYWVTSQDFSKVYTVQDYFKLITSSMEVYSKRQKWFFRKVEGKSILPKDLIKILPNLSTP